MRAGITAIVFIGSLSLLVFVTHRYHVLDYWIEWPIVEIRAICPEMLSIMSAILPLATVLREKLKRLILHMAF